jgi:DNA-binding transcriptional MocR family regulator
VASPITGLGGIIQRQRTTEQAADVVRQASLSGRLPPGTPLREAALAAEFGVSRSALREAARTLESEGLVRRQLLDALHGSPEQARAELTAHLQPGAAELQRLLDLLAHREELAHRKEREAPRG